MIMQEQNNDKALDSTVDSKSSTEESVSENKQQQDKIIVRYDDWGNEIRD
jgi:hypothetical protein